MHADQKVLTNAEYVEAVEAGHYPSTPAVPDRTDSFEDARGAIKNILFTRIDGIAEIKSKRGAVRANHVHRTDFHYAYVLSGRVLYFERGVGDSAIPNPHTFDPGEMFFTPPNREHAMLFAADSVILTFAKNPRSHANHEADLTRVEFITPEIAKRWVP